MALEPEIFDTSEMLERIRPRRRYDLAVVSVAALLAVTIISWSALRREAPRFSFEVMSDSVVVGDRRTGAVAFCTMQDSEALCSEEDSALSARLRRIRRDD